MRALPAGSSTGCAGLFILLTRLTIRPQYAPSRDGRRAPGGVHGMSGLPQRACGRRTGRGVLAVIGAALAAACSMNVNDLGFGPRQPEAPQQGAAIGTGQVKVGLILPLSASG